MLARAVIVVLLDGTYELFRAHFGQPSARGRDGTEVGAARGLLRQLHALLRRGGVTHAAVAFDHVIESFRNELYDGYKTSAGVPPELLAQFPLAERVAAALGLVVWPMVELEADDALATAAARFAADARVEQVRIASPDKDLAQCVRGRRVVCWNRWDDVILDEDGVRAKFGVPPSAIADLLALTGDAADGVPGVPRWGAKSAATVLARWGSIEAIPADPAGWDVKVRGAATLAANLAAHRTEAALYKRLTTLRTDATLRESLDDLAWRGVDAPALAAIAAELGAPRLAEPP